MSDKEIEVIAGFVKAARHIRNYPHPKLTIQQLRAEATMAESNAERILGRKLYDKICVTAFSEKNKNRYE